MDRVSVAEAAQRLGISKDAVRQRIRRHTIEYERDEHGTVYVLMSPESTTQGAGAYAGAYAIDDVRALVDALQNQIDQLGRQLDEANEANRENRRLLAAALERIPALESPEPRDARENGTEPRPPTETPASDAGQSHAPWWRRFFGFE